MGLLLLGVPFLPLDLLFGELPGRGFLVSPSGWALGLAVFLPLAWLLAMVPIPTGGRGESRRRWTRRLSRLLESRWLLPAGLLTLAGALVLVSAAVFRQQPGQIDSVVQLFQAKIFVGGALAAPAPPDAAFFDISHMIVDGGRWYSQFPPGHPAFLGAGVAAGAVWLVPVVLTVGSAALLHGFARRVYGLRTARLTLLLALLCPFLFFMGASFMNHVSALFFVAGALYLAARYEEAGAVPWLVLAGAALGAAALSRPLTAVAVAGALGAAFLVSPGERARRHHLAGAVAGFGAVAGLYLAYNQLTTGDALVPGYLLLWGESHGLGFHVSPWGEAHTPLTGLRDGLLDLSLLNLHLLEWPIPALLPLGLALAAGWLRHRWDVILLAGFLAIPVAYFFYWHRDAYLGPRFLYATTAFLLPLTARALERSWVELRDRKLQLGGLLRPVDAGRMCLVLFILCFGFSAAVGIPDRFRIYASAHPGMKVDLAAEARAAGIEEGVVAVKVSWGNRILSEMRGLGVPAPVAEQVYRRADHCDLHRVVQRARGADWRAERVTAAVQDAADAAGDAVVQTARLNDDPTLRIRTDRPLPEDCRREIAYDASGYTVFAPHLPVNSPRLDGPLVVARDLGARTAELAEHYPGRTIWRFDGERFERLASSAVGVQEKVRGP